MNLSLAMLSLTLAAAPAKNVLVVTLDGLRPSEVFTGGSRELMRGVECEQGLVDKYWRDDEAERRVALMPFLWNTVVKHGQLFHARVENASRLSYPGYNELFTGSVDPRIINNQHPDNPNVTVFEHLARSHRVQLFATWETFVRIVNQPRSHLDVRAGWAPPFANDPVKSPTRDAIDALHRSTIPLFGGNALDAMTVAALTESLTTNHPQVLFLGLGETDEWMHAGRYDLALEAAHRADQHLERVWALLQSMPQYRDNTVLIVTTDHGRGSDHASWWKDHGREVEGADQTWLAAFGPGVDARGVRSDEARAGQVAATIAGVFGVDWSKVNPAAAPPLLLSRPGLPALTAGR